MMEILVIPLLSQLVRDDGCKLEMSQTLNNKLFRGMRQVKLYLGLPHSLGNF